MIRITLLTLVLTVVASTIVCAADDSKRPSDLMSATISHLPAADQDSPGQESALAGLLEYSSPFSRPLKQSQRKQLLARAERGDLNAMYELAKRAISKNGWTISWRDWGDIKEAERWWRKAAALGDPKAMILLGHMYAEPWGVPQDLSEATNWFQQAAERGPLEAVQSLTDLYLGAWSDERDGDAALPWLKRAAAAGDRHAMLVLGLMYDSGWEIRENADEAVFWYNKVIDSGKGVRPTADQSYALNNLGVMYEEGRGVPKDEGKAAELYRRASGLPSLRATYNLAVLCEQGRGVPQDKTAALWLYRDAALFDLPEAESALKRLGFVPDRDSNKEAELLMNHDRQERAKTVCER